MAIVERLLPRHWDGRRLLQFLTGLALLALAFAGRVDAVAGPAAPAPVTSVVSTTVDAPAPVTSVVGTAVDAPARAAATADDRTAVTVDVSRSGPVDGSPQSAVVPTAVRPLADEECQREQAPRAPPLA